VQIEYDPAKRQATLTHRQLDFNDAPKVFSSAATVELEDDRMDYGERRIITYGPLNGRLVMIVWTQRGAFRRIISMRYANDREVARYRTRLGGP
jgi:hypothetical protein